MILVTGAAGFIGSSICRRLLDNDTPVIGIDNLSQGKKSNLEPLLSHQNHTKFQFIQADITDTKHLLEICKPVTHIIHQAALGSVPRSIEMPATYILNNDVGTFNVFDTARKLGIKRVVYASSSSVYGDTPVLPKVETMSPSPKSPYAITKLKNEIDAKLFFDVYGIETIGLRYFNVFGPYQDPESQYAAVIPKFITAALKNAPITIHGDGLQTRDFTYIDNVVSANLAALHTDKQRAFGKSFNIGLNQRLSVKQLAENIIELTQSKSEIRYEPTRAGDVKDSQADVSLAKELLDYTGTVSIPEGLTKTIDWFKQ